MKSKKLRKCISLLTLGVVLSTSTVLASAKGNGGVANNDIEKPIVAKKASVLRLGGGDSPSCGWEKSKSYYKNFTNEQLGEMSKRYTNTVMSDKYQACKTFFDVSAFIMSTIFGYYSNIAGVGTSGFFTFSDNYAGVIQQSANVATQKYWEGGTCAVYVTEYIRPASGEIVIGLSRY